MGRALSAWLLGRGPQSETALGEVEFVVDIALFLTLHGQAPDGAQRFLKPRLADLLKPAMRDAAAFRPALLEAKAAARGG